MTTAGDLRERLTFQSPASVDDGAGNEQAGFADEFTVWAALLPLRGGESVMADRLEGRQPIVIQVRISSDTRRIKPDWQAVDANDATRIFKIKAPPADMERRGEFFDILAEQGAAG